MSKWCEGCRFLDGATCRVGVCATVRLEWMSKRLPMPDQPCRQARPEPVTPAGVTALRVDTKEFPPTAEGYIAARAYQGAHPEAGELEPVRNRVTA